MYVAVHLSAMGQLYLCVVGEQSHSLLKHTHSCQLQPSLPVGMVVTFIHSENGPVPFTVVAATLNWYVLSVVRSSAVYLMPCAVSFTTVPLLSSSLYSTT